MLHESLRSNDRDPPARGIFGRHHAEHPAEVVDVRMGVDHPRHRAVASLRAIELESGGGGLDADQRVDHDHAIV